MWFGCYLYEKGVISAEQFAETAKIQLQRRKKFGAIAIDLGLLSVKQVMAVFQVQADDLEKPFGQIAVELGFLSRRHLAEIITLQSTDVPGFGPILVEMGIISEQQLADELRCHHDNNGEPHGHKQIANSVSS